MILTFAGMSLAIHVGDDESPVMGEGLLTNGLNLWKHITVEKPYTKWDLWPGKGKMYEGIEPHGAFPQSTSPVDKEGKVAGCIKCHSVKADNDWVFTSDIK